MTRSALAYTDATLARRAREAARVRRSGRRAAAAVTGLVTGLGLAAVAADLAVVAARGTDRFAGSVPVLGGLRPVDPSAAGRVLADLPTAPGAAWPAVAVLAVVGAWLVRLAVTPGGGRRRVLVPPADDRSVAGQGFPEPVIVDRGVVADALGEVVHRAAGLPPEQVSVRVGRRADVVVRPLNGMPVAAGDLESSLAPAVARWGLARSRAGRRPDRLVPVRVRVAEHGTVAS